MHRDWLRSPTCKLGFRIVAIWGREAIDWVRVDETNHLVKAEGP
jgi:hypothetical protein